MSNKRKLRLHPYKPTRTTISSVDTAHAWERCHFHDDCCDPDDMTCTGACDAPADSVLVLPRPDGSPGMVRTAFCSDHLAAMRSVAYHMLAAELGEAN